MFCNDVHTLLVSVTAILQRIRLWIVAMTGTTSLLLSPKRISSNSFVLLGISMLAKKHWLLLSQLHSGFGKKGVFASGHVPGRRGLDALSQLINDIVRSRNVDNNDKGPPVLRFQAPAVPRPRYRAVYQARLSLTRY